MTASNTHSSISYADAWTAARRHGFPYNRYRVFVHRLSQLARLGWRPDDIRHVFGPAIEHALFLACGDLDDTTPEPMRQLWYRCVPPTDILAVDRHELNDWERVLYSLPLQKDGEILIDFGDCGLSSAACTQFDDPDQAKAHKRILALLAKAESTTFDDEADALIAKAQTLRQRYRLDEVMSSADLWGDDATTPRASGYSPAFDASRYHSGVVSGRVLLHSPWVRYQFLLLAAIARENGCKAMIYMNFGIASVLGFPGDVRHVLALFASLNRQRDYYMRTSPGAFEARRTGDTSAYRRSFCLSYAARIGGLLAEASQEAAAQAAERAGDGDATPGSAQSLAAQERALAVRNEAVADVYEDMFKGKLRSFGVSSNDPRGRTDGVEAAEKSRLGTDDESLGQRRALER